MFIQTETTPNPLTLKFIPGVEITGGEPINCSDKEKAKISPLAELLFSIEHVTNVFLGYDFITLTKTEEADWNLMKPEILVTMMEYLVSGKKILSQEKSSISVDIDEDEISQQIRELIETRVRPSVAQDGGDIVFISFENGIVKLELHGSCSGCPSSSITLKNGIENMLKHYVPEVMAVEAVN